jgi:hypothetical protein
MRHDAQSRVIQSQACETQRDPQTGESSVNNRMGMGYCPEFGHKVSVVDAGGNVIASGPIEASRSCKDVECDCWELKVEGVWYAEYQVHRLG